VDRTARIVIVGDEVLAAEVMDRNGPLLLSTLARLGTRTTGLQVVADREEEIARAVRDGTAVADLVLVTGGIGPTHDDCTRPAVGRALGRRLVPHPEALRHLAGILASGATPDERAMADLPEGAELLTAPGTAAFGFRILGVFVFPGVPRLLEQLLAANLAPLGGRPWVRRQLTTRIREGRLAGPLRELAVAWPQVRWGSYPVLDGEGWTLRLVIRAEDDAVADRAESALRAVLAAAENSAD
jgi:molybdenum cofactor synthesis domain-containing protein